MAACQKKKNRKQAISNKQEEGKDIYEACRAPRLHRCLQAYLEYFRQKIEFKDENR